MLRSVLMVVVLWTQVAAVACGAEEADARAVASAEEPVKHLYVATLLLRRFEKVNLTDAQRASFDRLSGELRTRIDRMRADAGIGKDEIQKRDEVVKEMKKAGQSLSDESFWPAFREKSKFSDAQCNVFRETQVHYAKFKKDALALLTDEQRAKLPRGGKKRQKAVASEE